MFSNREVGTDNQFVPAGTGAPATRAAASRKNGQKASGTSNGWQRNPDLVKLYNEAGDLWESGYSYGEIADRLGMCSNRVGNIIRKLRQTRPLRESAWKGADRQPHVQQLWDRIWELRESGMTYRAIADAVGKSEALVSHALFTMRREKA